MKKPDVYLKELEGYPDKVREAETDYIDAKTAEMTAQAKLDALPLDSKIESEVWGEWIAASVFMMEKKRELNYANNRFQALLAIVKAFTD